MPVSTAEKRAQFRKLHESGCFVVPNPWDVGTAKALQSLGFKALASTSAGFAWAIGKADNQITLEDALSHLTQMCAAVDLPVNADFEGGFADEPTGVAANVTRAIETGIAGVSIEDSTGDKSKPLYDDDLAVARIRAARKAIDASKQDVMLVGRCEAFLVQGPDLDFTIARLKSYADAGADCLYAPGIKTTEQIAAIVAAAGRTPVNVLMGAPGLTVSQLANLGVRRISVGGALARTAWGAFLRTAQDILQNGDFSGLASGHPGAELNAMFRK